MIFRSTLVALSFMTFLGCANKTTAPDFAGTREIPAPTAPRTEVVPSGVRTPAADFKWEPKTIEVKISRAVNTTTVGVDVERMVSWIETESFKDSRNEWYDVLMPSTCYKVVCSGEGSGKSQAWNNYFSPGRADKAEKLGRT